jgi:anti-sigma factor RsiW
MNEQVCEFLQMVDAYHDGELSVEQRGRFERHLAACGICDAELRSLRAISQRVAAGEVPVLPADAMARLHEAASIGEERSVLRIAEWLTTAAAAVLLMGLVGLFRTTPASSPQAKNDWTELAVTFDQQDPTRLVEWTNDIGMP